MNGACRAVGSTELDAVATTSQRTVSPVDAGHLLIRLEQDPLSFHHQVPVHLFLMLIAGILC